MHALALKYDVDFTEQDYIYIVIFSDWNGIQVDMNYSKVFLVLFVFDYVVYAIYSNKSTSIVTKYFLCFKL